MRKAKTTLFAFRGAKSLEWTFCDPVKVDAVYGDLASGSDPVIIVCPRGAGGARRTYDHLLTRGISPDRLFILEKGQGGWPYAELLEK